ncbi:oxidation resistance protein 1 [Tritrichomonas musculus]
MMSETNTIIIGIGKDKESYNKNEIETINSSHGQMSGPAIWIGEDLQYASSSPCDTFGSPQLTKKNFFYVVDIEIWKFGFFSGK